MALRDIVPYNALSAGGGTIRVQWFQLNATTLLPGEPVGSFTSGKATEAATDPATVAGIVAWYPVNGFTGAALNYPLVNGLNPDRVTQATDSVPVYVTSPDQLWATQNLLSSNGTTLTVTPDITHVGTAMSLVLTAGGSWSLRTTGGTNNNFRVIAVVDSQGKEVGLSYQPVTPGAGLWTVFKQIAGF